MKELLNLMESLAHETGKDTKQVMDDLLTYIIGFFNPERKPNSDWHYTQKQNLEFYKMLMAYLGIMRKELEDKEWFDAWGDLFMQLTPNGDAKGQFFTPPDVCELMTAATVDTSAEPDKLCGAFGKRVMVSDPAAGSSRNLLAAHAKFVKDNARKPYLVAEDLDMMCCKMSAVNMMAHGCFGEVICHNTLTDPKGVLIGYIINEGMYPMQPGVPTIRVKKEPEWFVSLR